MAVHQFAIADESPEHASTAPVRAIVIGNPEVDLRVSTGAGLEWSCDWLETTLPLSPPLAEGDSVLVLPPSTGHRAVVIGRVRAYRPSTERDLLLLSASHELKIQCGESSIDLRADGKVMIRGDDVLVRAKGTKRIRAGTVSIN